MAGWHHRAVDMNLGILWEMVRDREVWCAEGHKELDTTGQLNNNKDKHRLSCETLKNSCC